MIIEILTLRIGCIPLFNERFPSMSQYVVEKKALCRWRRVEVPKGRRSFCSDACAYEHKLRSDPGYLREQVFQRDFGVCALCGTDCNGARLTLTLPSLDLASINSFCADFLRD
jgi:hypothetical protein